MKIKLFSISCLCALILSACAGDNSENARSATNVADAPKTAQANVSQAQQESADAKSADEMDVKALLAETTWLPTFLINRDNAPMPPEDSAEAVQMRFNKDLRVNGISGDNLFGGNVTVLNSGFFKALNLYSTRRAGPYGNYEFKFLQALGKANRIQVNAKTLKLFDGQTLLLEFKKKETK